MPGRAIDGRGRGRGGFVVFVDRGREVARWTLASPGHADLMVVELLAVLQLEARALGCAIEVREACPELVELLDFLGLSSALGVEVRRQAERLEQPRVEEAVVPDDPIA